MTKEFKSKRPLIPQNITLDRDDKETWSTFKMLSEFSRECFGAYVISMASNVSDILAVLLLQKEAGIKNYLRIVPLFETLSISNNAFTSSFSSKLCKVVIEIDTSTLLSSKGKLVALATLQ